MRAFWKYDLYPYLLSGSVVKLREDGKVEVKEYGPGYAFTPLMILSDDDGYRLHCKLEELQRHKRNSKLVLDAEYMAKLHSLTADEGRISFSNMVPPCKEEVATEVGVGTTNNSSASPLKWAEGLILQLPTTHDGRNSWLLNYGTSSVAHAIRVAHTGGL